MSDVEYYCPRCEAKVARWDFIAPPDFYRCWECLLATPFKDLPRRSILLVGRGPLTSQRIPRGTGGTIDEFDHADVTIENVTCAAGSTLVVGANFNVVGFNPSVGGFSFTWNGQTSTTAVYSETTPRVACGIAYITAAVSGTFPLVITPVNSCEIGAWVTEITIPGVPALDTTGSGFGSGPITVSCSTQMSSSPQVGLSVASHSADLFGLQSPFLAGQVWNGGIQNREWYAMLSGGTASISGSTSSLDTDVVLSTFRSR